MTKFTLREAHRIESRIAEVLNKPIDLFQTLSIYDDAVVIFDWLEQATKTTEETVLNRVSLIGTRGKVRDLIQEANSISGINQLVGIRKNHLDLLALLKTVKEVCEAHKEPVTADILTKKKTARREKMSDASAMFVRETHDTLRVLAIPKDMHESMLESMRNAYRDGLDAAEDRLATLNATTTVSFDDDVMEVLQKNKII